MKISYISPRLETIYLDDKDILMSSDATGNIGDPDNTPNKDDRTDEPITPSDGGDALSKQSSWGSWD